MPSKSKKTSPKRPAKKTKAELERPFDPKVWKKAAQIAGQYQFLVRFDPDEPYYYAFGVEARGAMGGGETMTACHEDILQAMTLWVATMLENGERPPAPASDEKRSAQVNVRLTADEKFRIEEAARRAGFRGVSDFVRAAALDKTG